MATLLSAVLDVPSFAAPAEPAPATFGTVAAIENRVETKRSAGPAWAPSVLKEPLFARDRIRTGSASRAAILYKDETLHRLNQESEVEISPPEAGNPGLLRVIAGEHYFSVRSPTTFRQIETPVVSAAIEGTEFVVSVAADSTTTITMLEGVVKASNPFGALSVTRGEQAYVEPGKAPVRRILVRPRDAVSWALYYPPVLGGADARRLEVTGEDGRSLSRAATLLSTGQVGEAKGVIEAARARTPEDPIPLALASVIEVATNNKEEAMRLAEKAVAADPKSPAAALALSFAAQAAFDIPRARAMAERAAELDPESSLALARAAELRSSEGDLAGAIDAARRAVAREPGQARALSVLGFAQLTQFRTAQAETEFEKAVASDPGLALARLGLGIALIRRGRLAEGRAEIQTAVALDPDDSLLRSYLAKADYEAKRTVEAGKELASAKELDPSDPTPYLYDAIRKQNENRPVEALDDVRESIARNDQRAVYRSRLLLDQDRAVRASDLARVYNDLGFEQLGLVTARRSADEDHANYSSHLFLAGNYRALPGFANAFLSEILQARIYQPVSVNAARPDVVNETVSFNEYTALFDRPRARAFGGYSYGRTDPELDKLFVNQDRLLDQVKLDRSEIHAGQIVGTWNRDRFAAAVGYDRRSDDGFRFNSDRTSATYRAFAEFAPTAQDTFQVNALYGRQGFGDLPLRQIVSQVVKERIDTTLGNYALGYHRTLSPRADLAVSVIYNRTEQEHSSFDPFVLSPKSKGVLDGPQAEVQQVLRLHKTTFIFGAGGFDGENRLTAPGVDLRGDDRFLNGYAYAKLRGLGPLELTLGASAEHVVSPSGFFAPRDSQIGGAEIEFTETRLSPKVGASLYLGPKTTLRAAGFYRLSPAFGRIQTLEPTQVAGFNQFFNDPGGTRSLSYGLGLDQQAGRRVFFGVSALRRELTIQEPYCTTGNPFSGCAFQTATFLAGRDSRDVLGSAYIDTTIGKRLAASVDYLYDRRKFDFTMQGPDGLFQNKLETHRARPQLRLFLPFGLFASARSTLYDQKIIKLEDLASGRRMEERARFWITDLQIGYRLPRRYGTILLDGKNLSDREFPSFDQAIENVVIPARVVTLSVNFAL